MRVNRLDVLKLFLAIALIGISDSLAFGQDKNLALKANNPKVTATQSSVSEWAEQKWYGVAANAIDGELIGNNLNKIAETKNEADSWFEVDLGAYYKINKIVIYPRAEACCQWFKSGYVIVTDQPMGGVAITDDAKIKASANFSQFLDPAFGPLKNGIPAEREISTGGSIGRYVRIQIKGNQHVQLSEIQIFGEPNAVAAHTPDLKKAWNSSTTASGSSSSSGGSSSGGASTSGASDPKNLTRNPNVKINATQSAGNPYTNTPARNAIDGNQDTFSETSFDGNGWFEVDLGDYYTIDEIKLYPRKGCCVDMFRGTYIIISDHPIGGSPVLDSMRIGYSSNYFNFYDPLFVKDDKEAKPINTNKSKGRYIRLQTKGTNAAIELAEIEIFGEKAQNYTANAAKKWDTAFVAAFDPKFPDFRGATEGYFDTLQSSPKIIGVKNSPTGFDIAFQDHYKDSKLIKVNTYEKSGDGFKKNQAKSMELTGLGVFAGFAKDTGGNRYIFTSESWKNWEDLVTAKVYKNSEELWTAKYFAAAEEKDEDKKIVTGVKALMNSFKTGTSRLVAGDNSLLITTNIFPSHPYQVILDTQNKSNNDKRAFHQSLNHHNFGQRAFFDGSDFVIMENRDHDVTVTLTKLNKAEVLPLVDKDIKPDELAKLSDRDKSLRHPGPLTKRLYSVYSHTNFANHTFTELGNVEKGLNDTNGYLVLFAGERDWNDKMSGFKSTDKTIKTWQQPQILSPRDIGLVHVKKDFEKETANWVDKDGKLSQCPVTVDTSKLVNSTGAPQTVTYKTVNDGWNWVKYAPNSGCEKTTERSLITKGVKWVTEFGEKKTKVNGEFISVNHPKLVRISTNKYVVLWEEWKAESTGDGNPKKEYVSTKAALISLKPAANGEVEIELSEAPKELKSDAGKVRLMPGDDAFEFEGKAAWAVGDTAKNKLMFYTVDEKLNVVSYELEL